MGYEISKITLSIENNYLTLQVEENSPKGEEPALPFRLTKAFFPKASATFNYTYKLVSDPKLGDVWAIHSVNIVHGTGQNVSVIFSSDITAAKVYIDEETTNLLDLQIYLTKNTGA